MADVLAEVYQLNYTKSDLKNVLIDLVPIEDDVRSTPQSTTFTVYLCTVIAIGLPGKCSRNTFFV